MIRGLMATLGVACLLCVTQVSAAQESDEEIAQREAWIQSAQALVDSLNPQHGYINIANGVAELHVPDSFYYLDPEDAEKVLVDAWGNPPGEKGAGMLLPAGVTPFAENVWAVDMEYLPIGYVSDSDAEEINYDKLLKDLQKQTAADNKDRKKEGFESVSLIGWAVPPSYDAANHTLHWAKELQFGDAEDHTLNYNVRVLGRKGILNLNFIAGMDQLPEIKAAIPQILQIPEFNSGYRYDEYIKGEDRDSGLGLAALVAGGGAAVVAKKTGFLALALIFLKKGWILIVGGLAAGWQWIKRLFGGGEEVG